MGVSTLCQLFYELKTTSVHIPTQIQMYYCYIYIIWKRQPKEITFLRSEMGRRFYFKNHLRRTKQAGHCHFHNLTCAICAEEFLVDGFLFKRAALKILLLVRCRSFIPLILPYFGLGAICTVQPSDAKVKMWSIMCSPISTVITQWDSRGLSMVGRSIALHFACTILECKICIVPMLL